jgi:Flp pilus assembly protein TadD
MHLAVHGHARALDALARERLGRLRGKLVEARASFLKAYELSPNDPTVKNNLELLANSVRTLQR